MFYGVTTNPKLLAQGGIACTVPNLAGLAHSAFDLGAQEIHLQVWEADAVPMLSVGRELALIVIHAVFSDGGLCLGQN